MLFNLQKAVIIVCLATFTISQTLAQDVLSPPEPQSHSDEPFPVVRYSSDQKPFVTSRGRTVTVQTDYIAGIAQNPEQIAEIQRLSVPPGSFPVEKFVVVPEGSKTVIKQFLASQMSPLSTDVKTISLSETTFKAWFEKNHNLVYTVVRFLINSTTVGVTIFYSWRIPLSKAILIALTMGSMSGFLQYKVDLFRSWIQQGSVAKALGTWVSPLETPDVAVAKTSYNNLLKQGEQYARWGLIEASYLTLARLAMSVAGVEGLPVGLSANIVNLVRTAGQSLFGQGLAINGLFSDLTIHTRTGAWSESFCRFFQDTAIFLISAASVAIASLQLLKPGLGGELTLWFIRIPYGYLVFAIVGIIFYLHAFANWSSTLSPLSRWTFVNLFETR